VDRWSGDDDPDGVRVAQEQRAQLGHRDAAVGAPVAAAIGEAQLGQDRVGDEVEQAPARTAGSTLWSRRKRTSTGDTSKESQPPGGSHEDSLATLAIAGGTFRSCWSMEVHRDAHDRARTDL
jgi:hypothetical protein